jgi:hypothetical protein
MKSIISMRRRCRAKGREIYTRTGSASLPNDKKTEESYG